MSDWLSHLSDLRSLSATAVYLVLFGFVFVESGLLVGFFLPGDSVLFTAGLLAAEDGSRLSLPLLAVGVFLAAVAGDAVGYWTGRRFGRPWLLHRAGRAAAQVERAEQFYARYGWWAVVIAPVHPVGADLHPGDRRRRADAGTRGSCRRTCSGRRSGAAGWSCSGTSGTACRG